VHAYVHVSPIFFARIALASRLFYIAHRPSLHRLLRVCCVPSVASFLTDIDI